MLLHERLYTVLGGAAHDPRKVLDRDSKGAFLVAWDITMPEFTLDNLYTLVLEPLYDERQVSVVRWDLDFVKRRLFLHCMLDAPWPADAVSVHLMLADSSLALTASTNQEMQTADHTARTHLGVTCSPVSTQKLARALVQTSQLVQRPGVLVAKPAGRVLRLLSPQAESCSLRVHFLNRLTSEWATFLFSQCAAMDLLFGMKDSTATVTVDVSTSA